MRRFRAISWLLMLWSPQVALGQIGTLTVHVTDVKGNSLDGIVIDLVDVAAIERTELRGITRIQLPSQIRTGMEVELQVPDIKNKDVWVFISPWNRRVVVPPFDSRAPVSIVLAKKSDRESLLGESKGRQAILLSILSEFSRLGAGTVSISAEQQAEVLKQQAAFYGLRPEDVDAAIRALSGESPDLFEQGLAALYQQNYVLASERLEKERASSYKELERTRQASEDRAFFLGEALLGARRFREAIGFFKEARALRGDDARTLAGLGRALQNAGDLTEAGSVFQQALAITRSLGADEELALPLQSNLSEVLYSQGELLEAQALQEKVVYESRKRLGAHHPVTLTAMNNLARTLFSQGDLEGARLLQETVLAARTQLLGREHPASLLTLGNLAETLAAQGDLTTAERLQEEVLITRRRLLGASHPDTLVAMGNLAATIYAKGDLARAHKLQEEVVKVTRSLLGGNHPDTLTAIGNLAAILSAKGDLSGARRLLEEVLEARRRLLGSEHPDTLLAMGGLASTLYAQGSLEEAQKLQEQVVEALRHQLGPHHPSTSVAEWNLLVTLRASRHKDHAREIQKSLSWLLTADEGTLSASQREIRRKLAETRDS